MADCYSGPNPVTDPDERMAIWKWAKENGIDHGLPFEKIHDAINTHFFGGMARPEWINDILSGRKTPFKALADDAWKAQYRRRVITQQAKEVLGAQTLGPFTRTLKRIVGVPLSIPRRLAVAGHGIVFPVTHGGDLILRPQSWAVFFRGAFNTWTKSWSPAAAERLLDSMKRNPLWDTALRSGLDIGERSRAGNLVALSGKGSISERAWSMLTAMRFELWNHEMQRWLKPDMSREQVLDIGKNLAEWANHATGSARNPLPFAGNLFFGPKLTASKAARLVADPVKTIATFANWRGASAGEKAVASTRLSGLAQYAGTGLLFLGVNWGINKALGVDDKKNVNFFDPSRSDWLSFKGGGLEWSIPGMHSEIKVLGQILGTAFLDSQAAKKALRGQSKSAAIGQILGNYLVSKATPAIGLAKEIATQQVSLGPHAYRPVPWSREAGSKKFPRYDPLEYALAHGPIPLTGPIRYFYDQQREAGASALDAVRLTKALIIFGLGLTGLHARQDYEAEQESTPQRAAALHQAIRRTRAAQALRQR
jgi:hypothetical protein